MEGQGAILSQPKSFINLLSETLDEIIQDFGKILIFVGVSLVLWILVFVLLVILLFIIGFDIISSLKSNNFLSLLNIKNIILFSILGILSFLYSIFQQAFTIVFALRKKEKNIIEIIKETIRKYPQFILTNFVMALIFFAIAVPGLILLGIPLLIAFFYFYFPLYIVVAEDLSGIPALIRSKQIVKGHWFKTFGNTLGAALIIGFIYIALNLVLGIGSGIIKEKIFNLLVTFLNYFLGYLISLFMIIFGKNLYFTLRESKQMEEISQSSIVKYRIGVGVGILFLLGALFLGFLLAKEFFEQFSRIQKDLNFPQPLQNISQSNQNLEEFKSLEELLKQYQNQKTEESQSQFFSTSTEELKQQDKSEEILNNLLQKNIYSPDDEKRMNDLALLASILDFLLANNSLKLKPQVVYLSLKDVDENCSSFLASLPKLPPGWKYHCSINPSLKDGKGWIPLNLSSFSDLKELPVDPLNEYPYVYTLVIDKNSDYELTAKLDLNEFFEENEKIFILSSKEGLTPSIILNR